MAGLKGLGFGMLGGLTSVITEPIQVLYRQWHACCTMHDARCTMHDARCTMHDARCTHQGAASSGVPGFFSGLGWGAVGVVTKPVIGESSSPAMSSSPCPGILDMATETASAVRESSRSSSRAAPARVRPPRVVQVGGQGKVQ